MTTGAIQELPQASDDSQDESQYDRCLLHEPDGIRAQLQHLIDRRCMLAAHGDIGATSMLTALLAVDATTLWVDIPQDEALLQRLLQCRRLSFDGTLDKITLRFSSGPAVLGGLDTVRALVLPLPHSLLHLQRRELMRREPPQGTLQCRIPGRDRSGREITTTATVRDIGGGGLAVLAPDSGSLALVLGTLLPGCMIDLPQLGTVEVTLCVRHVFKVHQHGRNVRQAGCEFINLPAATQAKLFRYLMQLDREQLARRRQLVDD